MTGYFAKHAFIGDGENPGFAVEAAKNIYEGYKNDDLKQALNDNILNLGMGFMIGKHARKIGNQFGRDLFTPQYQFSIDPAMFNQQYYNPTNPTNAVPLRKKGGPVLPKAARGLSVKPIKVVKDIGRAANIATLGTANSLAKTVAPIMWNPLMMATEMGPFTGSPLNFVPFYGKDLSEFKDNTAFRKFGDTLDYVKMTGQINPAAGPLLRMGKSQIKNEGNWAEYGRPNEQYKGVFGARFNMDVPGSDLGSRKLPKRNGVLITDAQGNLKPSIPISDIGVTLHRRLPFSNRYIDVNMDRLRNDQFDWRTQGGNLQSLIERYGYGAAWAAGLTALGVGASSDDPYYTQAEQERDAQKNSLETPQDYFDEYVNKPIEEYFYNPWLKPGVDYLLNPQYGNEVVSTVVDNKGDTLWSLNGKGDTLWYKNNRTHKVWAKGGLVKASRGLSVKEKEVKKIEPIKIEREVTTPSVQNLNLTGTSAAPSNIGFTNFIKPLKNVQQQINKSIADLSFNNYLMLSAPETMDMIAYLKNKNLISPTLPEGQLVTYPNLLNLATKRGIQDALTLTRSTAGTDFGISSSGTKTEIAPGDLSAFRQYGITSDPIGKSLYGMTHVPWMRYGQRTGLTNLPYNTTYVKVYKFGEGPTDYVVGNTLEEAQQAYTNQFGQNIDSSKLTPSMIKQATPDSFDALYTFGSNTGLPSSVRNGVFDDQYGSYTGILRYPFDYSGSAFDMIDRFNNLENTTFNRAKTLRSSLGKQGAESGALGAYTFTDEPSLQNMFVGSPFSANETPVIGKPGEKLLDPVAIYHKPELAEIDKEKMYARDLYASGKYNELIEHLNNRIKQGQFGNIESNIQRIKEKPEFTTFEFDAGERNRMADNLYMNGIINPETGLIDTNLTGAELEKLANLAYQSYNNYLHFGPRENAYYNKNNVVKIPYSPFRFKFKKGGELPKARFGKAMKLPERLAPQPRIKFGTDMSAQLGYRFPSVQNRTIPPFQINPQFSQSYWNTWNNLPQGGFHKRLDPQSVAPQMDSAVRQQLLDRYLDLNAGEMITNPALTDPLAMGKQLGDFVFKDFSDGWAARQSMMNMASTPQWAIGKNDFYKPSELTPKLEQALRYNMSRWAFDEMYPESMEESLMDALTGGNRREELFANLFPGVSLPNFRDKFLTLEQEKQLQEYLHDIPSVYDRGMLNTQSLKSLTKGEDTLPRTYQELLKASKENNWLKTAPAKDVVSEMRGGLGLTLDQIMNASPEQFEKWRQEIVRKMYTQAKNRWEKDMSVPMSGFDAFQEFFSRAGSRNKFGGAIDKKKEGGVAAKLTQAQINKYIADGYIVEEE